MFCVDEQMVVLSVTTYQVRRRHCCPSHCQQCCCRMAWHSVQTMGEEVATEVNFVVCSCVFYIVSSSDADDEFWHSSLITERLHWRVVCSSTGTTYKLTRNIVKPLALAQGTKPVSVLCIVYTSLFVCSRWVIYAAH